MKIKLLALLGLPMLLASCAQDDVLDNTNVNAQNEIHSGVDKNSTSRGILDLTRYKLLKESTNHPQVLEAGQSISMEYGGSTYRFIMQTDNNLVLYRERPGFNMVLWHSNTYRSSGTPRLIVQNDGNMVIYRDGNPLWSSNTAVNYHVANPHVKLQLYSRAGAAIPTGYRIKVILGGNNEERNDIIVEDFL
ncbi:hypothetical protein JET18_09860 [Chryseobacterium sp. L7]|uniref:Bulb-type lectin domain-containing protein n=1 Tax=Chryseobacterium endalhagicum TaxID=2797638 RepID=A0ABS1QEX2_9FLAO|nr:hypothetical protein [Chryseobacterium endalhagicum]MBL1221145.1 hypothetical protein [Chryseobacterium endalhagicum]